MAEDRFERLANLITFLLAAGERGGRGVTFADIVTSIPGYPEGDEARRRAFERDKRLLRDEDIPLHEQDGRYRIPAEEYYLPDLHLGEDEQLALQLAVAAVPVGEGGREGLQKLLLGGTGAPAARAMADLDEHPLLPTLHAAIRKRATVTFVRDGRSRTVEPASLFFRDGNWYLFGYDRLRGAERNFRVDRLGDDVEVGEAGGFEPRAASPAGRPDEMMPRQPWLFGADDPDDPPEQAVVRVDAVLAAKAIADAGPSATVERDGDGSVTLTMPVRHQASFREWVLGMLDHAEVVGPPARRADVLAWLQAMAG